MIVFKEFGFEAAHWLPRVPEGHKCSRMHGHSYMVRVEVEGPVCRDGMVIDYAVISDRFKSLVHNVLDHRVLNETPGLENSTSEILAQWIFDKLTPVLPVRAIEVRETATAGARVEKVQ